MDFSDTTQEAEFRAEAAAWLKENVPTAEELEGLDEIAAAKLWQKRKYDAGWACIGWSKEYGGRGASAIEQVIWNQEESKYETPGGVFVIGQGMAAPTLMTGLRLSITNVISLSWLAVKRFGVSCFRSLQGVPTLQH